MEYIFLVYFLVYKTIELSCMESMIVYSENVCRLSAFKCMGMKKKIRKIDSHERTFKNDRHMSLMGIKMTLVLVQERHSYELHMIVCNKFLSVSDNNPLLHALDTLTYVYDKSLFFFYWCWLFVICVVFPGRFSMAIIMSCSVIANAS